MQVSLNPNDIAPQGKNFWVQNGTLSSTQQIISTGDFLLNFLKFQIKISLLKKRLPWLAIIKKNNKFVYLINKKLKFRAIEDQKVITGIKKKFSISKKNKHHFLIK